MNKEFQKFKELIANCSEIELFFIIDYLGKSIRITVANLSLKTHVGVSDLERYKRMASLAVDQTVRFGVSQPREDGRLTKEYADWYHKWDGWKKAMSKEDWDKVEELRSKNEDIGEFLPIRD